ncbi:hypothetical protein GEMRC1_011803 [Eukaryota sp. GEM-RC1]
MVQQYPQLKNRQCVFVPDTDRNMDGFKNLIKLFEPNVDSSLTLVHDAQSTYIFEQIPSPYLKSYEVFDPPFNLSPVVNFFSNIKFGSSTTGVVPRGHQSACFPLLTRSETVFASFSNVVVSRMSLAMSPLLLSEYAQSYTIASHVQLIQRAHTTAIFSSCSALPVFPNFLQKLSLLFLNIDDYQKNFVDVPSSETISISVGLTDSPKTLSFSLTERSKKLFVRARSHWNSLVNKTLELSLEQRSSVSHDDVRNLIRHRENQLSSVSKNFNNFADVLDYFIKIFDSDDLFSGGILDRSRRKTRASILDILQKCPRI